MFFRADDALNVDVPGEEEGSDNEDASGPSSRDGSRKLRVNTAVTISGSSPCSPPASTVSGKPWYMSGCTKRIEGGGARGGRSSLDGADDDDESSSSDVALLDIEASPVGDMAAS